MSARPTGIWAYAVPVAEQADLLGNWYGLLLIEQLAMRTGYSMDDLLDAADGSRLTPQELHWLMTNCITPYEIEDKPQ